MGGALPPLLEAIESVFLSFRACSWSCSSRDFWGAVGLFVEEAAGGRGLGTATGPRPGGPRPAGGLGGPRAGGGGGGRL